MGRFIEATTKPVLIVGGAGTALAGFYAFAPRFAVEKVQGLEWVPEYTIFVQHWGIMVSLIGVFMVAAAFKPSWRAPVLLYGLIEKAFLVFLVGSNASSSFAQGLFLPAGMDALIAVWAIAYFLGRAKA